MSFFSIFDSDTMLYLSTMFNELSGSISSIMVPSVVEDEDSTKYRLFEDHYSVASYLEMFRKIPKTCHIVELSEDEDSFDVVHTASSLVVLKFRTIGGESHNFNAFFRMIPDTNGVIDCVYSHRDAILMNFRSMCAEETDKDYERIMFGVFSDLSEKNIVENIKSLDLKYIMTESFTLPETELDFFRNIAKDFEKPSNTVDIRAENGQIIFTYLPLEIDFLWIRQSTSPQSWSIGARIIPDHQIHNAEALGFNPDKVAIDLHAKINDILA